eukprot:scaffold2.g7400.t1
MRGLRFDVEPQGAYAVHVRLTPSLLEALRQAGVQASIRLGPQQQGSGIAVGGAVFPLLEQGAPSACDLLHVPTAGASGGARVVAAVRRKLIAQRNVADERGRMRARAEEAEREKHERGALVLDGKPAVPNGKTARAVTRVTPPPPAAQQVVQQPRQSSQQQLRVQPPAPAVLAPGTRPPVHPGSGSARSPAGGSAAAGGAASPPASKPLHKSASAGKLGGAALASPAVVAAARAGGLRGCLLALLAERLPKGVGSSALKAAVAEVAARVRSLKRPGQDELVRTAKQVAEHRSPGIWVLHDWLRKEANEALARGRAAAGAGSGGGRARSATPTPRASPPPPPAGSAGSPASWATASGATAGSSGQQLKRKRPAAAGSKRRIESSSPEDDGEEAAGPAAKAAATARGAAGSPLAPASAGGGGSGGPPPRLRTSSGSRSSREFDDSWLDEYAQRPPAPAAPITSRQEYEAAEAAFARDYDTYFRLHQRIEANKKDFAAMAVAIEGAGSAEARARYQAQVDALWARRGERAERWDAAFRGLHAQLAALKARMADYVAACRGGRGGGGGAGDGGGAQRAPQAGKAAAPPLAPGPEAEKI